MHILTIFPSLESHKTLFLRMIIRKLRGRPDQLLTWLVFLKKFPFNEVSVIHMSQLQPPWILHSMSQSGIQDVGVRESATVILCSRSIPKKKEVKTK